MEIDPRYGWAKKGKRYKARYLSSLGQLFGEGKDDKECQLRENTDGRSGTDQVRDLDGSTGD